jgi:hypothetical protein
VSDGPGIPRLMPGWLIGRQPDHVGRLVEIETAHLTRPLQLMMRVRRFRGVHYVMPREQRSNVPGPNDLTAIRQDPRNAGQALRSGVVSSNWCRSLVISGLREVAIVDQRVHLPS